MEDMAVSIPDIRALVAERQRFDDWLSALEAKRDATPVRVYDRVHADYVARRDAVIGNLHTHVEPLESLERELTERLQKVELELSDREDERAEAMLRRDVGEYDADKWEATQRDVGAIIEQLGKDREALTAEAEDVRTLLASARHKPAPEPEPAPQPLIVASAEDTAQELVSPNVAAAIAHADPAVVEHTIDLDETGDATRTASAEVASDLITTDPFLRAVGRPVQPAEDIESAFAVSDDDFADITGARDVPAYGQNASADSTLNAASSAAAERDREADDAIEALGADTSRQNDGLDDIDVFGEPRGTPRANAATNAPEAAPRNNYGYNDTGSFAPRTGTPVSNTPDAPVHPMPPRHPSPPSAPARDAFDDLAFLRSITEAGGNSPAPSGVPKAGSADQAKTLRCTECGTMNFPTEWYCERCGGELAAF